MGVLAACSLTSLDGFSSSSSSSSSSGDAATAPSDASLDGTSSSSGDPNANDASDASRNDVATDVPCDEPGLVVRLRFDDPQAKVYAKDCTSNHHDGVYGGASSYTIGTRNGGGSFEINGSAFVSIPSSPSFEVAGALTVASFVRSAALPTGYLGVPWHFPGAAYELTMASSGKLYAQLSITGAADLLYAEYPTAGLASWTHLAMVYEPGVRFEIFTNGKSTLLTPIDGMNGHVLVNGAPTSAAGSDVRIGSIFDNATSWQGGVDVVRIYARALSAAEIEALAAQ